MIRRLKHTTALFAAFLCGAFPDPVVAVEPPANADEPSNSTAGNSLWGNWTKLMKGHPRIEEVRNRVAIKRGPLVYFVESPDLPAGPEILDVFLPENSNLTA